jgi:hypothetical protein
MRFTRLALVVLALPVLAQQPTSGARPNELMMIERYAGRVNALSAAIKRDAFIVAQIVAGLGELKDFQRNVALSKALDRIEAARKRGSEEPKASIFTMTAISKSYDAVKHAQQQGGAADLEALRKDVLEQTQTIRMELFKELDLARRERQALVDTQRTLAQVNQDLDGAMIDALGTTFDFFRAGGK